MGTEIIESERMKASISTKGAELISLIDKQKGTEHIWNADEKYWKRHAPVLFPIVGSLKEQKYTYKGRQYKLSQHGFARDMEFETVSNTGTELWMRLAADDETKKNYPFDFELNIGYRIFQNQIIVLYKVLNNGREDMFFSIGAHPAFLLPPAKPSDTYACAGKAGTYNCSILFENLKTVICSKLTKDGLAKAEKGQIGLEEVFMDGKKYGALKITPDLFNDDAFIVENHQTGEVALADADMKKVVSVKFDAPLFGFWSPAGKDAPFVCIEPWYGRCDAENFSGTLEEREYEQKLVPGGMFYKNYHICI
jgi:galactose mutarotase-like enzyme